METADVHRRPNELGFGRYQITGVLGVGSVGTVYRATDREGGPELALKVLNPTLVGTVVEKRFLREGRIQRTIDHPHVIRVHDLGRDEPFVWFTMELMDRGTIHQFVKAKGPLPVQWTLHVAEVLLGALHHLHQSGWVHRDVKPGNVLLHHTGEVKLGDFGILRDLDSELTHPGIPLGTSSYMSPEQCLDPTRVTPRSDVYSFGATMYAMSTGQLPKGLVHKRRRREVWEAVPAPLLPLIRRACAVDPAQRYTDAEDMRAAVRVLLAKLATGA
jgi:serine/threonine protein kinase